MLIGVERQDPAVACGCDTGIALRSDGATDEMDDPRAGDAGEFRCAVGRAPVDYDHLIGPRDRRNGVANSRRLVEGRHHDRDRELRRPPLVGGHGLSRPAAVRRLALHALSLAYFIRGNLGLVGETYTACLRRMSTCACAPSTYFHRGGAY